MDRWFHFALPASVPREAHDDTVQAMEEARAAWLQHSPSVLASHQSYELRDMLGRSENRFHMHRMDDHEIAKALYKEVKNGNLLFVPERDEMRKCVQAIRQQREKASRSAAVRAQKPANADMLRSLYRDTPRVPQNFDNAQPFKYTPDAISDDVQSIAARGVSEAHDAECHAQYERDMDECTAYRMAMGGQRFMDVCSQRAFQNYQRCRGY
ncbi:hypothetical protein [Paraburkholderia tuberum]|uniref:hypothetical protein n=1 Tax=Paraburkholderia TaxID=1822464 RepID=UPI001FC8061B|nr:hypothetical protein [Paraburkholderia tuberum]